MTNLKDGLAAQALGCPLEVQTDHGRTLVMSWETGRLHWLTANHPDREIELPDWALPDFDVIAGRAWPVPIMSPDQRQRLTRQRHGLSGPTAEEMVAALSAAGCRPIVRGAFKWRALCPVCRMRGKSDRRVYVERDFRTGRDRLSTFCHCGREEILVFLGLVSPEQAPRRVPLWRG